MKMKYHNLLAVCILCNTSTNGQAPAFLRPPVPPLEIPLSVSGNFMELRGDHFHAGVDLRTNGVEGLPVKAVADGHVSRIKVSPWGYGLALYIDHPEGLTTVYGHLQRYAPRIAEVVLEHQYKVKEFAIDIPLEAGQLPVTAGELVAWSGNTGGSGGPHLHYEVRRTRDQHALDPQVHGLHLADKRRPVIRGLRLYPLDTNSRVSPYPGTAKGLATTGGDGRYTLQPGVVPAGHGRIGLAVHAVDHYDGSHNTCGVRRIEVLVDERPHFTVRLEEVDFDKQRYCNAHMDHELFKRNDMHYHRCYRQPNNRLPIYEGTGDGHLTLLPGQVHLVRVVVHDASGNRSELDFQLKGASAEEAMGWTAKPTGVNVFRWDRENVLVRPGFRFQTPALALYDDEPMRYVTKARSAKALSDTHMVMDDAIPLHLQADVSIETGPLPEGIRSKVVLVRTDSRGRTSALGGAYADGWVKARTKAFGSFHAQVDTLPPVLQPVDLREDMRGRNGFKITVKDDLSGVESWRATLDGRWIVLAYDPKTKTLSHVFDRHSSGSGERQLTVVVTDERGNRTERTWRFTH